MRPVGFEPTRPLGHGDLNTASLPVPPGPQAVKSSVRGPLRTRPGFARIALATLPTGHLHAAIV
jgi:hypothetical protein